MWAATAGNKFRQAAKARPDPETKLRAEGPTALAEAVRELDQVLGNVGQQVRSAARGY